MSRQNKSTRDTSRAHIRLSTLVSSVQFWFVEIQTHDRGTGQFCALKGTLILTSICGFEVPFPLTTDGQTFP